MLRKRYMERALTTIAVAVLLAFPPSCGDAGDISAARCEELAAGR
jgi:hypothetical protein